MRLATLSLLLASGAFAVSASAQEPIPVDSPSPEADGRFGAAVSSIGDLDGDDIPDALIGARGERTPGGPLAGRVHAVSGATGAIIRSFDSPDPSTDDQFGAAVEAAGDLNGDGVGDVLVGAPNVDSPNGNANIGRVYAFSGADASLLYGIDSGSVSAGQRFGRSVARVGDLDGDGINDFAVGIPGSGAALPGGPGVDGAGRVHVRSGADGSLLLNFQPEDPQTTMAFGAVVDGTGDLDGDGLPDILVGVPRSDVDLGAGPLVDAGEVRIHSGADGSEILRIQSPSPSAEARLGTTLSRIGDLDGDDSADLVTGERDRAYAYSATGILLRQFANPSGNTDAGFGSAVAGTGDLDDDGAADIFVSAPAETANGSGGLPVVNAGRAYIFSSTTGAAIRQIDSPQPETGGEFGAVANRIGDVNGDNAPDLIVGAPGETSGAIASAGRAYIVLNPPAIPTQTGPLSLVSLKASPNPVRGTLHVEFAGAPEARLVILDALGRVVARVPAASGVVSLETREWAPGLYIVRLLDAPRPQSVRVTVLR